MKYYLRLKTGAILTQKQYDNVPHHNPQNDNYLYLGDFETRPDIKLEDFKNEQ